MNKFLLISVLVLTSAVPSVSMASMHKSSGHQCTMANTVYVDGIGCVMHITDPATLAKQIDTKTGKPISVRIDHDPMCDGHPSGYIYEIQTTNPVDGKIGVTGRQCD